MAGSKGSYENTWADQWDDKNQGNYAAAGGNGDGGGGGGKGKYSKKVEEGLSKTKEVASTGMKKVKAGASVGFVWIKDKYQKTTNKKN
ncbi:hypothetical protein LINGRAHAP2_LOCUS33957 [Linum grandiflorum]